MPRVAAIARDASEQEWQNLTESPVGDQHVKACKMPPRWRKRARARHRREMVQSDEVIDVTSTDGAVRKVAAENLVFHDAGMSELVDDGTLAQGNYDQDSDSTASLGNFLQRPVRIATYSWAQGGGFLQTFKPWNLYFNTPQIKNKLQNFGKIKCRLHLKFLINASPFHYGSLRACYFPLNDERNAYVAVGDLIPASQTPGVWIEPATMDTAEMVLPFLWPHNWLEVTELAQFTNMGQVNLFEYANLKSANGATSAATITVYAWAEDVTVMGPTSIGALQSDEYESNSGTISGPASAVASVASRLVDVPVIGPFAKATEMGASMVSGVARLFGYSNPPVIDDVMPMQNKSFHAFANSETRMPIDKLSLDPKNEVTVSSAVAGVEEKDPLVFTELLGRESFLLGTNWDNGDAVDTLLWSAVVSPHYAYLSGGYRTMPPLTYFAQNFRFWRGSIVYKFKFIKTKFHRGRVLISFDPNGDISANADTETTTFSRIVDLEHEDEVEFAVPYKATPPLLLNQDVGIFPTTFSSDAVPVYTYDSKFSNGTITMRVQTTLTGPTTTADVTVLTYVKAGKDFQFAGPRHMGYGLTTRDPLGVIQSSEVEDISQSNSDLDVHVGLITTGEVIASMRPLCHRTHFQMSQFAGNRPGPAVGMVWAVNRYHRIPPGPGRAADAYQNGNLAAPYPYNFTQNNPIDWTLNCFVGYRGSMNLHVNPIFGGANVASVSSLAISRLYGPVRYNLAFNFNGGEIIPNPAAVNAVSGLTRALIGIAPPTGAGSSVTNPRTQAAISANLPQYWPLRFYQAFQTKRDIDPKSVTKIYDHFIVNTTFSNNVIYNAATEYPVLDTYYSAGVDWSPVFFLCTPRVFITLTPSASDT